MTCISFQVFRRYHDHKTDGPFVAKHFVGPATDRAHTFDRSDAVVSYQHLEEKQEPLVKTREEKQTLENWLQCYEAVRDTDSKIQEGLILLLFQ